MSRYDLNLVSALRKVLVRGRRFMGVFLNLGLDFTTALGALMDKAF